MVRQSSISLWWLDEPSRGILKNHGDYCSIAPGQVVTAQHFSGEGFRWKNLIYHFMLFSGTPGVPTCSFPPTLAVECIKSVPFVCLSVRLSVSRHSPSQTVCHMDLKFSIGIDFDDISDEFDGQGHRSKVKVMRLKNVIFVFQTG